MKLTYERMPTRANVWVYFIRMDTPDGMPMCKVGISGRPKERLRSLQGANPYPLHLVGAFKFRDDMQALAVERGILEAMKDHRVPRSEWVKVTDLVLLGVFRQVRTDLKVRSIGRIGASRTFPHIALLGQAHDHVH